MAASTKLQVKTMPPKVSLRQTWPQDGIERPSGPDKSCEAASSGPRCGKTLTAALVSTRYNAPVTESFKKIRTPTAVSCHIRQLHGRFLNRFMVAGSGQLWHRSCHDRSRGRLSLARRSGGPASAVTALAARGAIAAWLLQPGSHSGHCDRLRRTGG
jgi:hypothetical protein